MRNGGRTRLLLRLLHGVLTLSLLVIALKIRLIEGKNYGPRDHQISTVAIELPDHCYRSLLGQWMDHIVVHN